MDLFSRIIVVCTFGVVVSIALTGCAGGRGGGCYPSFPSPVDAGETGGRGKLEVDASSLAPGSATLERLPVVQYRHLTPMECQCLAARNAPLANVVELETQLTRGRGGVKRQAQRDQDVMRSLLRIRAIQERNRAAADALESYYRLAEAEANRDLLDKSMAQVGNAIKLEERMRREGVFVDITKMNNQARRIDLLATSADLNQAIEQLNSKLRFVLHLDPDDTTPIWPDVDLTLHDELIDVDEAIGQGLASRPDLAGLRLMRDSLSDGTLAMIEQALTGMGMVLATDGGKGDHLSFFSKHGLEDEIQLRRRQLSELYYHRKRAAVEEIRQAVRGVETAFHKVSLATAKVLHLETRRDDLDRLRDTGDATPGDVFKATMEILEAKSALLSDVIQWKIAHARLRESQGLLAEECDYALPCACCR